MTSRTSPTLTAIAIRIPEITQLHVQGPSRRRLWDDEFPLHAASAAAPVGVVAVWWSGFVDRGTQRPSRSATTLPAIAIRVPMEAYLCGGENWYIITYEQEPSFFLNRIFKRWGHSGNLAQSEVGTLVYVAENINQWHWSLSSFSADKTTLMTNNASGVNTKIQTEAFNRHKVYVPGLSYNWWGFTTWDTLQNSTDNSSIDKVEISLE